MNVTRAAERLHTVRPSVIRQIHRLEEIVGTPLFHRERHKLELTNAGGILLKELRLIWVIISLTEVAIWAMLFS
jgi:DNA-binding transcriptional LysR family regulator